MASARLLEQTLEELYGNSVKVAALPLSHPDVLATEPELRALGQAVPQRTLEFAAGRTAVRKALHQLRVPVQDILIGEHRQPLPPAGVFISISHDKLDAIAVAGSEEQWFGLGVDIGDADSLDENLISHVCHGRELLGLAEGETIGHRAKLIFCLKEALFKAIYPQVGSWMEFSQSELVIDFGHGSYEAKIFSEESVVLPLEGKWFGRFAKVGERWVAAAGMYKD